MKIKGKEIKLPKRLKEKWIKALRSGDFIQGTEGNLYKPDSINKKRGTFCCLGVIGSICGISTRSLSGEGYYDITNNLKAYKKGSKILPKCLLGTDDDNILVRKLSEYNDSGKWSFKRIANYIEKNL